MIEGKSEKTKVLSICSSPFPKYPVKIVRELKKEHDFLYRKSPPPQVAGKLRKEVLQPLVDKNFLLEYTSSDPCWEKAKQLCNHESKKESEPVPRKLSSLYQTHFLLKTPEEGFIFSHLAKPDKELNIDLQGLLFRFNTPKNFHLNMLNLLLSAKEEKEELLDFLYEQKIDYKELDILERVLERGSTYAKGSLPFDPNVERAKKFLGELTEKNTGSEGGLTSK